MPTHPNCNFSFQKDEEYFAVSLTAGIKDTYLSIGAFDHLRKMSAREQSRPLLHQVVGEFSKKIGSIYLPSNLAAKTIDRNRFDRVIWKIIRGIYFFEFNEVLPVDTENSISEIYQNSEDIPFECAEVIRVSQEPFKGNHPRILEYKIVTNSNMNMWLLIMWNSFGIVVCFHIEGCQCDDCQIKSEKDC